MEFSVPIIQAMQRTLQLPENFHQQASSQAVYDGHPFWAIGASNVQFLNQTDE